ncbi:MAG: ATP-binding protein [Deltaproteobacteria bacterium]|nr:ATP-binding protein [Deltaproteobacteria bacterium]
MLEQEIQNKISDFRESGLPDYIPREGKIHQAKNTVSTIIGARRAGKSYRALQFADELLKAGVIKSLRQVCPIDFDNPILSEMKAGEIKNIAGVFLKMNPEFELNTPLVFIFDEIHKIKGWELAVIDLSKKSNWKIIVTGSSSKLLRDDIATELRGKSISSIVYPLNFREFLKFKRFEGDEASTKSQAEIKRHFDAYLKWGGYPAMADTEDASKPALLHEYFDTMILRDILQRYDVSKPNVCTHLCRFLLSNIARPATIQSVYNTIKESGFTTSRDAVRDYIHWARDSWLLFLVDIFSKSHKEQERNYKKIYCVDWGLACFNSPIWDGSLSRAFENMIFLQLIRSYARLHFYLTKTKRQEVDFVALERNGHPELAVQVCMDISRKDTLKRELEPLITTAKYFGIKENLLITLNHEEKFHEEGVTVNTVPAWKWLVQNS